MQVKLKWNSARCYPIHRRYSNMEGIITTIESISCQVDTPEGMFTCTARGKLTESDTAHNKPLTVGDRVELEEVDLNAKDAVISAVKPRTTRLSRSHPSNPRLEHIIAANVEQALIVCSVKSPPLTAGIIDRYVIAAEYGGIEPVICINKFDLANDEAYSEFRDIYTAAGYTVLITSAKTGKGIDELKKVLKDKTTVLSGHSGVGKSSLLNAIQPNLQLKTAPVGFKGTHCTAKATLMKLDFGGYVVDTPGIRELQPWDIEKVEVQQFFNEIWEEAKNCKLPACTHLHEPSCAVKTAVGDGRIPSPRYDSYLAIMETIEESSEPRKTDVDDPAKQIPKKKRKKSRRRRRQDFDKLIDEHWDNLDEVEF